MKVEVNLTLVKDQNAADANPRKPPRVAREGSPPAVVRLLSQENQQARRLDPSSLTEARTLFLDMARQLARTPEEVLAEVHLLESHCLVRLP
jgi:hypothetical protein